MWVCLKFSFEESVSCSEMQRSYSLFLEILWIWMPCRRVSCPYISIMRECERSNDHLKINLLGASVDGWGCEHYCGMWANYPVRKWLSWEASKDHRMDCSNPCTCQLHTILKWVKVMSERYLCQEQTNHQKMLSTRKMRTLMKPYPLIGTLCLDQRKKLPCTLWKSDMSSGNL